MNNHSNNSSGQAIAALSLVGLVFASLIIGIISGLDDNADPLLSKPMRQNIPPDLLRDDSSRFAKLVKAAIHHYNKRELVLALNRFDKAENILHTTDKKPDAEILAFYYAKKAELHWQLWQVVEARQAWQQSLDYLKNPGQIDHVKQYLVQANEMLEKINKERNMNTVYRASPNRGPAANLDGHIAVVFFYIKEQSSAGWGLKQQQFAELAFNNVKRWYTQKSSHYQKSISFSLRKFIIKHDPQLKRTKLKFRQSTNDTRQIVTQTLKTIGQENVADFIRLIKNQENADSVALVFLVNREERSFALRCLSRCASGGEFAFILENARTKNFNNMEYTQAHEILHLFGADDLYNISKAKFYAPRDIMNYNSKFLGAMSLEPITAYAVGLTTVKPNAPFLIKRY